MNLLPRRWPRQDHDAPNVNAGSSYPPVLPSQDAMIAEAIRIGSSPEGLGHAIGRALARQYGAGTAYRVSDAVARGIQQAMKEVRK